MLTGKDINELKNRFKPDVVTVDRFAGAYVNGEGIIATSFNKSFLNIEDSEFKKYLELLKGIYSPKIGTNTLSLSFNPDDMKQRQGFLLRLAQEGLTDSALSALYQDIMENFSYVGSYLILVFHDTYDVIKKASDDVELEESEDVYQYISVLICPVHLQKAGLQYNQYKNLIDTIDQDWIIEKPSVGFVYPAFEQRKETRDHLTYYVAKSKETHPEIMEEVCKCVPKYTDTQILERFGEMMTTSAKDEDKAAEYLTRIAIETANLIDQEKEYEIVDDTYLGGILDVAGLPEDVKTRLELNYRTCFGNNYYPIVRQLHDEKKAKLYLALKERNKGKDLLKLAQKALSKVNPILANDISTYLGTQR